MLATVNPSRWSLMLLDIEQSTNIVDNEASHLLVTSTLLTNKRT